MVRVALVSDTHGTLDARIRAVVAGCDQIVHAGDIGGRQVLDELTGGGGRLVAITGNNDVPAKWPSDEEELLKQLPSEAALDLPGGRLVVVHGDRVNPAKHRHERLRRLYPEARLVIYGHSHRLVCDQSDSPWVVNPGAAGRSRTFGGPSMVLLTATARGWTLEPLRYRPMGRP